jgi:hypothetical protein
MSIFAQGLIAAIMAILGMIWVDSKLDLVMDAALQHSMQKQGTLRMYEYVGELDTGYTSQTTWDPYCPTLYGDPVNQVGSRRCAAPAGGPAFPGDYSHLTWAQCGRFMQDPAAILIGLPKAYCGDVGPFQKTN